MALHVSTVRISTRVMPRLSSRAASSSLSIRSAGQRTSPVSGSTMSRTGKRPRRRSANFSIVWPFSLISSTQMPWSTPQSSSRMMTSWLTSTRRRVR